MNLTNFQIQDVNDIWTWLQKTVVRGLYASRWYNNDSHVPGFVGDHYSNLFGGSRLRQLRIKESKFSPQSRFINLSMTLICLSFSNTALNH